MDICSTCGQEVRYGVRNPTPAWPSGRWLHRDPATDADHTVAHGPAAPWEVIEANLVRQTADRAAKKKRKGEGDELEAVTDEEDDDQDDDAPVELPEPEQRATTMEPSEFAAGSGIGQMLTVVRKAPGWELRRLTQAVGPYVGANGKMLSMSESIVLGTLGPALDGVRRFGVASWRDRKFDFAMIGLVKDGRTVDTQRVNSTAMKAWIKEPPA